MRVDPNGTNWILNVIGLIAGAVGTVGAAITGGIGLAAGFLFDPITTALAVGSTAFALYSTDKLITATPAMQAIDNILVNMDDLLTEDSYSKNKGFEYIPIIQRWLYARQKIAKKGDGSLLQTWRYFGEYSFHMYAWMLTFLFYTGNKGDGFLSDIANSAVEADVDPRDWETIEGKWSWRNVVYIIFALLGI